MEPSRRKRIPTHLHVGQLRDFIGKKPCDFDALVAVATYRAETIRSQRQTREIDLPAAAQKFERNPFAWTEADAQLWSLLLVARWSSYRPQANGGDHPVRFELQSLRISDRLA